MIRSSIKPKDQVIIKNISKFIGKNIRQNLHIKYRQKFIDHAK